MTLDDRNGLGPAEILLLEAADRAIENHGTSGVADTALAAQARKKLPEPEVGTGGELIQPRDGSTYLYNTLDYPDFIAADASATRMHLVKTAGALALGVDTADTIQASNSAEMMLAHQMAAAHAGAMKLMGQLSTMMMAQTNALRTDDGANLRATRLAGAASRLMQTYQQGLLALDRIRTGNKQNIIVQHVQVNDGGQAVVAGKVRPGGREEAVSGSPKNQKMRGRGPK